MKDKCSDCYNIDNDIIKAEFLVLNHPFYPRDVKVCRYHLAVIFDRFSHESKTKKLTVVRLEV